MAQRKSGYTRKKSDGYYTPIWPTQLILKAEGSRPSGAIVFDPACGMGHILRAAMLQGWRAMGSDIIAGPYPQQDFFELEALPDNTDIWSNPPYSIAVKFIEHALRLAKAAGAKVVLLLSADFDSGKTRRHLFQDNPAFARKYVLTDRIRWANLDQKEDGPSKNHAWYVWDFHPPPRIGRPVIYYLFREAA